MKLKAFFGTTTDVLISPVIFIGNEINQGLKGQSFDHFEEDLEYIAKFNAFDKAQQLAFNAHQVARGLLPYPVTATK